MSENIMENTVAKTSKSNAEIKVAAQEAELKALRQQLELQQQQIAQLLDRLAEERSAPARPVAYSPFGETVKIIHMVERAPGLATYIHLSNLDISMTSLGEERTVTLQQFEELVGKYRSWFVSGIISVAAGYEEIASHYGLKVIKDYPLNSALMTQLGTMDMAKFEEIYNKLPTAGKDFIIGYWKRKIIQGDGNFKNVYKVETLNRLSNGACQQVLSEIYAENSRNK